MVTNIMKWLSIAVLLLALLWPSSAGYKILLGFAVWAGAILGAQASRAGKYSREAGYTMVPHEVKKYEN